MTNATTKIAVIRILQARIRQQIAAIQNQLASLSNVPASQPWISTERVRAIAELRSPHRSIFEALRADLEVLKRELAALGLDLARAEREHPRENAVAAGADFNRKLEAILRVTEKAGEFDSSAFGALRAGQEKAASGWATALQRDPSQQNMANALEHIANSMALGLDEDSPGTEALNEAVSKAAKTMKATAETAFRRNPTTANFKQYLDGVARCQLLGDDNYDIVPSGLRHLRPEKTHRVTPGETLSSLARQFYGSPGYWDVIYMENVNRIGNNPDRLAAGTVLNMP